MEMLNLNTNNGNEEVRQMNVFEKLAGVLVNPAETMKSIAAKPGVLIPMLIMVVAPLLLSLVQKDLYESFIRQISEASLAANPAAAQMTQEQIQANLNLSVKIATYAAPVNVIVSWLLGTAILFGIMKIFKGQGSFKQYLSVTGYASVITAVSFLLTLAVSYVTGSVNLNSSLALLVPDMKGELLYGILRGLDLFIIWHYAVIAIGVSVLSKVGKAKVYSIVGLMFAVALFLGVSSYKFM